eukprot:TRINITY_DN2544_c0_g1_i1.p2 TRINITY_DN2544_c0_g1~~TRINITY_DN2544_c0_g1_i1.p2  ORF type:complete len:114 (+),score=12.37 TRINITY_DN2544_c0_g1_i1:146-487(+)
MAFSSKTTMTVLMAVLLLTTIITTEPTKFSAEAGPVAYAACQTACNYGAVTCYASVGLTFGTVTIAGAATGPIGWWAWLCATPTSTLAGAAACSAAQGTCMAACVALLTAPTP